MVTWAKEETVERLKASGPTVKRWGGVVMAMVGGWLVALGVFAHPFARLFPVTAQS